MKLNSALLDPLKDLADIDNLRTIVKGGSTRLPEGTVSVTGCGDSQKLHMIAGISPDVKCRIILTYDDLRARAIADEFRLYDENTFLFPAKDLIFFQSDINSNDLIRDRVRAYRALLEKESLTIVTTFAALMTKQIPVNNDSAVINLKEGGSVDTAEIASKLTFLGYERSAGAETPGQFAIRGDIIDIFDLTEDNPYRIETWGDDIESIRIYDPYSQRSIAPLESVSIYPASEMLIDEERMHAGLKHILADAEKQSEKLRKAFRTEEAARITRSAETLKEDLVEIGRKLNLESYLEYFYPDETLSFPEWIKSLFGKDVRYFADEPVRCIGQGRAVEAEFRESQTLRLEKGYALPKQADVLCSADSIIAGMEGAGFVGLSVFDSARDDFSPRYRYDIGGRNVQSYNGNSELLEKDLLSFKKRGYKTVIFSQSRTRAARMQSELEKDGIACSYREDLDQLLEDGTVTIMHGYIERGFEYPMLKLVVIAENDIFGGRIKKKKKKKASTFTGTRISVLEDLHPGDYVVHETYGLGVYKSIEKIASGDSVKDYIKLEYAGGGVLYVLATELDMVQKYASADIDKKPKINRLGTKEWERTKSKARASAEGIARDLVELYAKRQSVPGFVYGPDTIWQREFEETFPFEETEDQLSAIRDTKADMESGKVMDRLICGDVGFGKTEIAIRAAFKAVQEGKQVACLVPTTILAQQHFATFTQRMKDFPVSIGLLSRFRTTKEIKKTIDELRKGLVDIVIGTHRLLSDDVGFKDLGLLIIDEEQRFGVSHKEKIKKLRENVDVLTLSATPIPRTLEMSLAGIRDMSLLEEPPTDRQPIQTFVCEYNDEIVREAMSRELVRGGQVYYLYNNVRTIPEHTEMLRQALPNARIEYAHGQMKEKELEDVMYDFVNGDIDILVSTTIIETGMDIPNVNTLIIYDADRFGLSQLYQLRGRVGRSSRVAFAFLMYRKNKVLSEVAEKRLGAVREFTDLGSGYRIALRDLEIRGAGNLLGKTQHGHMEAVGYDLYCKMLGEAVGRLKGDDMPEDFTTVVNLDIDAFIPREYIFNEEQKLDMYKRIASIENENDMGDMRDELLDRFGKLPLSAENLLKVAYMRRLGHNVYLTEIKGGKGEVTFSFKADAKVNPSVIPEILAKHKKHLSFSANGRVPAFSYRYTPESLVEKEEQNLIALTLGLLEDMQIMRAE
ncbi:MAG: transcription-repair coupling factor [Lachnospiraceae bacterium]|nr:transcription-repair coupling factor [Lachnospiraceae bacterium]